MKSLSWLIAGVGIGVLAYYIYLNEDEAEYATGSDDLDTAAFRARTWGTKQRVKGKGRKAIGAAKRTVGGLVGDDDLAVEGSGDQIAGTVKEAAGSVAHAVGETIKDLNQ